MKINVFVLLHNGNKKHLSGKFYNNKLQFDIFFVDSVPKEDYFSQKFKKNNFERLCSFFFFVKGRK
ncbi:hypothetical protein BCR26_10025 [Enterococcus rivorum]|uniref:Uncharacterized protein n=1 Tax=Enterococcus rivorum TaxID=762845 RepID=A0A1E5L0F2_9ENTE|nr:hypothetical protein BCR26_10025 [Enterococcus rivorum]